MQSPLTLPPPPKKKKKLKHARLRGYSKLRKADLIYLLRSHDGSTRTSMEEEAQKQFNPEELDNEEEVYSPFDDPMITEKGTWKQFDSEESDEEDEANPSSDDNL